MKCNQQSGFTLIELMIVVAIIGILAAIAIPSYMDYTKRAKVSELILATAPLKSAISEYRASEGSWPTDDSAVAFDSPSSAIISSINSSGNTITATGTGVVDNVVLTLEATATGSSIQWTCGNTDGAWDNIVPSNCREN